MQNTATLKRNITIACLLFLSFSLYSASWYVKEKQQDYRSNIQVKLAEQEVKLISFAELLDRDSVDSVVNQIFKDCKLEERSRFDSLLGSLASLNRTELIEIDKLFDACGSFFADRQAILTIRFQRELEIYSEYITLLSLTGTDTKLFVDAYAKWQTLSAIQKERSELNSKLVDIQELIIEAMVLGKTTQSDEIQNNLVEAQNAKDLLSVLNVRADTLRAELSAI